MADYLAVIAISVGRNKNYLRILSLLESKVVMEDKISMLAGKHGLSNAWTDFKKR